MVYSRLFWGLLTLLFAVPALSARTNPLYLYRAEEDLAVSDRRESPRAIWLELRAGPVVSWGQVKDKKADTVSRQMQGWNGSLFLHLSRWIALGAQIEKLDEKDQQTTLIKSIKRDMWAGLLKWTLTPETEPKIYTILGLGKAQYHSRFLLRDRKLDFQTLTLIAGLGVDIHIWKGLYLLGEYQLHYDMKQWDTFVMNGPHDRHEFSAAISLRF